MDGQAKKCVMIIREDLPKGLAANTAALLGITLGKRFPEIVGEDLTDAAGKTHPGISRLPVPILRGSGAALTALWEKLSQPELSQVTAVDFSRLAQGCRDYGEYREKLAAAEDPGYTGIALFGPKKSINYLSGNLPLL